MKKILSLVLLALIFGSFPAPARAQSDDMLVTPAWLKEHLADPELVLLHVGAKADFEKEHIAGAQLVSTQDVSIPRAESALVLQLLPPDRLRDKLQSLGISDDSWVVVYFGSDWVTPATRIYFSLEAAGLSGHARFLDGGLPAWKAAGGAVTDAPTKEPAPGVITAKPRPELVATLDQVKSAVEDHSLRIIDARAPEFYSGASPGSMPRAGHIPGARNIPFSSLVTDGANTLKPKDELLQIFDAAGVKPGDTVVTYCHIGQQASLAYLAARRLGLTTRLYDGSWDEWSRDETLKVEVTIGK